MNPFFFKEACALYRSGVAVSILGSVLHQGARKSRLLWFSVFSLLLLPNFEYQAYSSYFLGYMCIGSTYVVKVIDIFIRTCIMNTADEQSITWMNFRMLLSRLVCASDVRSPSPLPLLSPFCALRWRPCSYNPHILSIMHVTPMIFAIFPLFSLLMTLCCDPTSFILETMILRWKNHGWLDVGIWLRFKGRDLLCLAVVLVPIFDTFVPLLSFHSHFISIHSLTRRLCLPSQSSIPQSYWVLWR